MEKILSLLRRAVDDYQMIEDGDTVAVGCSGGKDSTLLLAALNRLSKFYPKKFKVIGISLDMGTGMDFTPLIEFCKKEEIELIIKKTEISKVVFDIRHETNPCSLCAKMRRGALNDAAVEAGANKIALGHHNDDVLETFMLNLVHAGKLGTFRPVTYLSRMNVTVIRPLIYIAEKDIKKTVKRREIPVLFNPCPANGKTERQTMKDMIADMEYKYRGFKVRMFGAIKRSHIDGWHE